jgi:hypothetical protein
LNKELLLKKLLLRPLAVGFLYLLLIPAFGVVYYLNPFFWQEPLTLIQSLYFSVVTITTLGYGDITPQTESARILTALEACLGIVTIGLFLNAVARRSDEDKEARRKEVIRAHLCAQYREWRSDLVAACLRGASGGYSTDMELEKELADFQRFREYFSGNDHQRWYDVLNGLQSNEQFLEDILVVSDLFAQQVNYSLGTIQTEDTEALAILTRVAQRPYLLKNLDVYSADPVKYIGQYVFEILGMYSVIHGNLGEFRGHHT